MKEILAQSISRPISSVDLKSSRSDRSFPKAPPPSFSSEQANDDNHDQTIEKGVYAILKINNANVTYELQLSKGGRSYIPRNDQDLHHFLSTTVLYAMFLDRKIPTN